MNTTNPTDPVQDPGDQAGAINPAAIAAGHEPDKFDIKPIFSIPLAVVLTFVLAFGLTTVLFFTVFHDGPVNPEANPEAKARGSAPLNDRISRTDRQGLDTNSQREVDQPRLEPLRRLENNGQTMTQPPLPKGNSPWLHPEDILPDRIDALQKSGYATADKKIARISIDDAIRLATEAKDGTNPYLPAVKGGARPLGTENKPSAANGGVGIMPVAPPTAPAPPKPPEKK